jgi:branched-chain amino acid transport system permease protein
MTMKGAISMRAALICLAGAGLSALPYLVPPYYHQFAAKILIMGILAMALNLVTGFGGLVSLCHAAFFGLGGYALALTSPQYEAASLWITLPLAAGTAGLAALIIGALSLNTRGVYFIMVTLAFGQMLFSYFHDTGVAGGSDGAFIYFKPALSIPGLNTGLENARIFYFATLIAFAGAALLVWQMVRSPLGHALVAARDNERRARSLGFPIFRIRLTAFTISGALAGLAGYFNAAQYGFVAPEMLGWHLSATVLVMVVLGGMETVLAPALGAAALLGMEEVLKTWTEHWKLVEGGLIIVLVILFPGGLRQLIALVIQDLPLARPSQARLPQKSVHEAPRA